VSKKNLGSSIDDFLKKENIFEEAQGASNQGSRCLATGQGDEEEKDFQGAHGGLAENEPLPGRSHS
jgi:hypothetical protein